MGKLWFPTDMYEETSKQVDKRTLFKILHIDTPIQVYQIYKIKKRPFNGNLLYTYSEG